MKRMFSCSSSQVAVESWNKQDQKLLEAVEKGDVGRVAALAARKTARPAKLNAAGQSAFHLAASKGLTECLTLLLAHGAPVNEKNDDGSTALHLATIACQPQCVKVLLQYGANESHVDGQNRTPLHWAASSGCAPSVLLLCDHEAPLDVTDAHGQTPLMLAARGNHAAICAQLLQRGADPNLADGDKKTALALAREHGSLDSAELLLSHGAAVGDKDPRHDAGRAPSRTPRWLPRGARGRARGNGTGSAGDPVPQVGSEGEGTPGSASEEEEEDEDEEQQDGCDVRWLRERLARKTRECQRLAASADGIRQRVRELARLLPGGEAGAEDEDGACLALLAQHVGELRKRMMAEEEEAGGGTAATQLGGDAGAPALAPFLAWVGDACAKMRAAKASALARSKGLRKEVEEALRSKLHYEVVSAAAVRRSLAAWEKLAVGLEQALSRADETHAKMLQGSRLLLEQLRREPAQPLAATTPCRCPVNGTEPPAGGKSRAEPWREGGSVEKEMLELKESNGMLLGELARLGRQRERLREELRALRERDAAAQPVPEGAGAAALARALATQREETRRLRRELAALRDGVGERVREAGGDASAGVLRELHRKLDGLARSQHEALQLVAAMEGDSTPGDGDGDGDGDGLVRSQHEALQLIAAMEGDGTSGNGPARSQHEALQLVAAMEGDGTPGDGDGDGPARSQHEALQLVAVMEGTGTPGDGPAQSQPEALQLITAMEGTGTPGDGPAQSQHEALQLVAVMEGDGTHGDRNGPVRSQHEALQLVAPMKENGTPGDGAGLLGQLEEALGELAEALGPVPGPRPPGLLERIVGIAAALRGPEAPGAEAERWRAAGAAGAARERREAAAGPERSRRARAGELCGGCRDKDGKMKKLLAEVEKLSAEVLGLRSQSARLRLQLELQQKNHREVVAVYRTHLLHAAQGFMDEGVHAMLLRILRMEE